MITLTEKAAGELRELMTGEGKADAALRVWVAGGGCSGLSYGMALDDNEPEAEDKVFEHDGIKIVVDPISLGYMSGAFVDYIDDPLGGGFKIENPNATSSCGCGNSFKAEGGEVPAGGGGCGSGGCGCR
jgi:iron-sulfur cluster assembly accessory protein